MRLNTTGSPTITGTMWEGLRRWHTPMASRPARTRPIWRRWRSRSTEVRSRWPVLAVAAAAGGSAVVKMKPEAKLRTKSHSASDAVI